MTSAQTMHANGWRAPASAALLILIALVAGCRARGTALQPAAVLRSPYSTPRIWAVVPPVNESGVSDVDTARMADALARELQSVDGIDVLPVNRTIAALRRLEMHGIGSIGDARRLARELGADGLVIGSLSAWDPYPPPVIGLALELHDIDADAAPPHGIDPVGISRSTGGEPGAPAPAGIRPVAQAAGVFDAREHRTMLQLREYAAGRHAPDSAYGADIHLVRMDLYAQFVSHRLIRELLWSEQSRLGSTAEASSH